MPSQSFTNAVAEAFARRSALDHGDKEAAKQHSENYNYWANQSDSGLSPVYQDWAPNQVQNWTPWVPPEPEQPSEPVARTEVPGAETFQPQDELSHPKINNPLMESISKLGQVSQDIEDQKNSYKTSPDAPDSFVTALAQGQAPLVDEYEVQPSQYLPIDDEWNRKYKGYFNQIDQENANNQDYINQKNARIMGGPIEEYGHMIPDQSIDDGSGNEQNRKSQWMWGYVYRDYIEKAGIPGRDVDDINPYALYNKLDEERDYGFIPYRPNENASNWLDFQGKLHSVNDALERFGQTRTNLFDYKIDYNVQKFSGKELDDKIWDYLRHHDQDVIDKGQTLFNTPEEAGENAIPLRMTNTLVQEGDKTTEIQSVAEPEVEWRDDGLGMFIWPDTGETYTFEDGADVYFNHNIEPATPDQANVWQQGVEPLVLDDGRTLNYIDAFFISQGAGDKDYGPLDLGAPAGAEDVGPVPGIVDMMLQSAPLTTESMLPAPFRYPVQYAIDAAPKMLDSMTSGGLVAPGSRNPDGSYTPTADDVSDMDYWGKLAGYAAAPILENSFGPNSANVILKPIDTIAKPLLENAPRGIQAFAPISRDMAGEAIEEAIAGNLYEEAERNGFSNWYANPVVDEDTGEEEYSEDVGAPQYDPNTPIQERIQNFIGGMPEAAAGGATLAGILDLLTIPGRHRMARQLRQKDRELEEGGVEGRYKMPQAPTTQVPEDLRQQLEASFRRADKESQ